MLHGNDILANHSYQFAHDAAETFDFYAAIQAETGFESTRYRSGFCVPTELPSSSTASNEGEEQRRIGFRPTTRDDRDQAGASETNALSSVALPNDQNELLLIDTQLDFVVEERHEAFADDHRGGEDYQVEEYDMASLETAFLELAG